MKRFLVFLVAIIMFSCTKKKNAVKPDLGTLLPCFEQGNWNKSIMKTYLLGNWQMNRAFGGWVGEMPVENVKLRFLSNDSLFIYKDGALWVATKYSVDSTGNNYYSLVTDSITQYLPGRILGCSNQIVFSSSFVDGNDYYYSKL